MQVTELKALREDTPEPELPGEIGPTSSRSAAYYTTMGVTDLAFPEAAEKEAGEYHVEHDNANMKSLLDAGAGFHSPVGQRYVTEREAGGAHCGIDDDDVQMLHKKHPHISLDEIRSLGHLFFSWDIDGDGFLSMTEMAEMLDKVVDELFHEIDRDGSGSVDRSEIRDLVARLGVYNRPAALGVNSTLLCRLTLFHVKTGQSLSNKEFEAAMKQMDNDESGQVSLLEFRKWWSGVTEESDSSLAAKAAELQDLFAQIDQDHSGEIEVVEFVSCVAHKTDPSASTLSRKPMAMVRLALERVRDDVRAIYGMRSRPKTALQRAKEVEVELKSRCCFFHVEGRSRPDQFRKGWDAAQVILLGYVAIMVPFRWGFESDIPTASLAFWVEVFVDIYFVTDIVLNFRTTIRTVEGDLVMDPKEIAKAYMKSWFFIDMAACLPVTYVGLLMDGMDSQQSAGQKIKMLKIIRLLRLAKMLRLARVRRVLKRIDEEFPGVWNVSKLTSLVVIILYVAHIVSCIWHFCGLGFDIDSQTNEVQHGWVHGYGYTNSSDMTRYLDAYYFSITTLTTVGYGDRTATTEQEKIFSIFAQLIGGMVFGLLIGTLSKVMTASDAAEARIEEELELLKNWMLSKRVRKDMRQEIVQQMENFYKKKTVFDESSILGRLPPKFRKNLLLTMYRPQIIGCPLFTDLDDRIITRLAVMMNPYLAVAHDLIVREDDVADEMYMVVKGLVRLSAETLPEFAKQSWTDGAFFGELPLLGLGCGDLRNRHVYDVTALTETDLTFISRADMEVLEYDYPILRTQLRQLAVQRARRFGLDLKRVTLNVTMQKRRVSIALDGSDHAVLHAVDPEFAARLQRDRAGSIDLRSSSQRERERAVDATRTRPDNTCAQPNVRTHQPDSSSVVSGVNSGTDATLAPSSVAKLNTRLSKIEEAVLHTNMSLQRMETRIEAMPAKFEHKLNAVLAKLESLH